MSDDGCNQCVDTSTLLRRSVVLLSPCHGQLPASKAASDRVTSGLNVAKDKGASA